MREGREVGKKEREIEEILFVFSGKIDDYHDCLRTGRSVMTLIQTNFCLEGFMNVFA